jgi:hypothetical protein
VIRNLFAAMLVLFTFSVGPLALAGPPQPPPPRPPADAPPSAKAPVGKVGVELMVVHAHNEDGKVDPRLTGIMQNLRFIKFKGFRLLDTHPASLGPAQESTFSIVGGRQIRVQLLERDAKQAKVRVRMFSGDAKVLDTTVSIHRNRSFMLAGPKHNGGVLIFAVSVKY